MINAANSHKNEKNIVIKRADKTSLYVIPNVYKIKLDDIWKIIKSFKKERNKTEYAVLIFAKIFGDYYPGYIYDNIKINKKPASAYYILNFNTYI